MPVHSTLSTPPGCESEYADSYLPRFLSPDLLGSEPLMKWNDFLHPKLRKFSRLDEEMKWGRHLGSGMEGCTWNASFGNDEFAVKVFWGRTYNWWSFKKEARNVAILEKIHYRLGQHAQIRVREHPGDQKEMLENLRQFSDDPTPQFDTDPDFTNQEIWFPLRKCHGWINIPKDRIPGEFHRYVPREIKERSDFNSASHYFAIVYEYMPKSKSKDESLENLDRTLKALRWAGFALWKARAVDWIDGRLADYGADIENPLDYKRRTQFKPPRHEAETFFPRETPLPPLGVPWLPQRGG